MWPSDMRNDSYQGPDGSQKHDACEKKSDSTF